MVQPIQEKPAAEVPGNGPAPGRPADSPEPAPPQSPLPVPRMELAEPMEGVSEEHSGIKLNGVMDGSLESKLQAELEGVLVREAITAKM